MKAKKTGIYKKWKERSHSKVSLKGANDGAGEESRSSAGNLYLGYLILLANGHITNMKQSEYSHIFKQ